AGLEREHARRGVGRDLDDDAVEVGQARPEVLVVPRHLDEVPARPAPPAEGPGADRMIRVARALQRLRALVEMPWQHGRLLAGHLVEERGCRLLEAHDDGERIRRVLALHCGKGKALARAALSEPTLPS